MPAFATPRYSCNHALDLDRGFELLAGGRELVYFPYNLHALRHFAEHRKALEAVESEIETVKDDIAKLEKGVPVESGAALKYSSAIKRN